MRHLIFLILLFMAPSLKISSQEEAKKTICLNMIVKNESSVIKRSLGSVKDKIDYWVILDTGSTDGTQAIIKEFMHDIPGELHEDPFKNFEYSRNKALDFAKGKADYILFIDADEELKFDPDFKFPVLDKDYYYINIKNNNTVYVRNSLINDKLNWRWHGVLHEYIHAPEARTVETLNGVVNIYRPEGARSKDPRKFYKDAEIFEEALKENPNQSRYRFYLAQSYRDAGEHKLALENYRKRIEMGDWDEEVFWSMLNAAHLEKEIGLPPEVFLASYIKAYQYRPTRAEPLYYVANYYRMKGDHLACFLIGAIGANIPLSKDRLFVQKWVYDWGLPIEYSVGAYWTGNYAICRDVCLKMLANGELPEGTAQTVKANLQFANQKIEAEKLGG